MNADSSVNIGSTHSLCQDYVIARNGSPAGPYVILSDGCSSSPDTDIGARLLVKALDRMLSEKQPCEIEELHRAAARTALGWTDLIGVPAESVDGTLLSAHVDGERLILAGSGDGLIVVESVAGVLDVYAISSPSGYPFYPAYLHQPLRLAEMVDHQRLVKELKHFRRDAAGERLKLLDVTSSESLTEVFRLNLRDYKFVGVASDGLNSFFHTHQSPNGKRAEAVCLLDALHQFWSFKNSHGAFVERRMKRFKKDADARSWHHTDDLSIGVIHLGDAHVRQS